jgi:hypothetical protein
MKEASAFGAAICGKLALEGLQPEAVRDLFQIEYIPVARRKLEGLSAYRDRFHSLLGE